MFIFLPVEKNYQKIKEIIKVKEIITLKQCHSNKVVIIDDQNYEKIGDSLLTEK